MSIVDPQAEIRLLGIALREPRFIDDVMTQATEQSFASDRAKVLFDAVQSVYQTNPAEFSRAKVQALLRQSVGGDRSVEIMREALTDSDPRLFDSTLGIVTDLAQRRAVLMALTEAKAMVTDLQTPMEEIRNTTLGRLTDALGAVGSKSIMLAAEMHEAYWRRVRADRERGAVSVIPTGIGSLQAAMRGYQAGDVVVVGAATGVGKTHFMLNQALFAASRGNITVLFSLEMTWEKIYRRLLRTEVGPFQEHRLTDAEIEQLENVSARTIAGLPLIVVDKHGLTGQEIASICRVIAARHGGLDFVVVDYIQRCGDPAGGYREKRHAVAANMDAFEQLAADMRVPVMIGSQVSRNVHDRADKVPQVSDMMESSSIEHLADVIMLLYRPDYYLSKEDPLYHEIKGIFEVHIPKNRDAEDKEIAYLGSDLSRSKFWDLTEREIEAYADAIERENRLRGRRTA